jgi:hypothetical protein
MTDRPAPLAPPGHARSRRWRWPIAAAVLFALAALTGYTALPALAERWLENWLADHGAPDADVRIADIDLDHVLVTAVSLGDAAGDATAGDIEIRYRFGGLVLPTIEQITIAELQVEFDPTDRTRPLGIISDLIGSFEHESTSNDGQETASDNEVPAITIKTAMISLPATLGGSSILLSGTILPGGPDSIIADLTVDAASPAANFSGSMWLESDLDGNGTIRLDVAQGSARYVGPTPIEVLNLAGTLELTIADAEVLSGAAELRLDGVQSAGWPGARLNLTGQFDDERWIARIATDGTAAGLDGWIEIAASPNLEEAAEFEGAIALAAGAPWWALFGLPTPSRGMARIEALGEIAVDLTVAPATLPDATATITVFLEGMDWPARLSTLDAIGAFDITMRRSKVAATASSPILIDGQPDPDWLASLGGATIGISGSMPVSLEIDPGTVVSWAPADGGEIHIAGSISVAAQDESALNARGDGELVFNSKGRLQWFDATHVDVQIGGLAIDQTGWRGSIDVLSAVGTAGGLVDDWTAELMLTGRFIGIGGAGLSASGIEFELPTAIHQIGSETRIIPTDATSVAVSRPVIAGLPIRIDGIRARIVSSDEPLLQRVCTTEGCTLIYRLDFRTNTIAAYVEAATEPASIGPARIQINGSVKADGTTTSTFAFNAESLSLPDLPATAEDLRFRGTLAAAGKIAFEGTAGNLSAANLVDWVPVLAARFSGTLSSANLKFNVHLSDENEWVVIDVSGTHSLHADSGSATVDMQPIRFRPGGFQPWDIAPALESQIQEATGQISLGGGISWNDGHVGSDLVLRLEELSIVTAEADLARINGVIALRSLAPLVSQPNQQVSIAQIDIGVPLTNALVIFSIEDGPLFAIENAHFDLAGGTVKMAPIVIDPGNPDTRIELQVTDMNLGAFLALADVAGLTATGLLTGTIPVDIRDGDIIIVDGRLDAEEAGTLKYAPNEPPAALRGAGETASLVLGALADFRYDQLWLTLDRDAGGETGLGLHVRGSNPDFYDGYPIELNLSLTGELDRILRDSLVGYRIPDYVKEQLEDGNSVETHPETNAGESP